MSITATVKDWLNDEMNDAQRQSVARAQEAQRKQSAQFAAEKEANARAQAAFDAWQNRIDAMATSADADALALAQGRIDDAMASAEKVGEELAKQRATLLRMELKSASDLESATLDDLAKLARGKAAAADDVRNLSNVVSELDRRHSLALADVDDARRAYGELRTRGLSALADEMAAQVIVDAGELAGRLREVIKLQSLIAQRGGSSAGRVPAIAEVANRLENMVAFYRRDFGR